MKQRRPYDDSEENNHGLMSFDDLLKNLPNQGLAPAEDLIEDQTKRLNEFYAEDAAPLIMPRAASLKWNEMFQMSRSEYKALSKDEKIRLNYWFGEWAKPVSSYADKEHLDAQKIFFSIARDLTGFERADFNWSKFRVRYFKKYPEKYAEYKAHKKSRKGKKK